MTEKSNISTSAIWLMNIGLVPLILPSEFKFSKIHDNEAQIALKISKDVVHSI